MLLELLACAPKLAFLVVGSACRGLMFCSECASPRELGPLACEAAYELRHSLALFFFPALLYSRFAAPGQLSSYSSFSLWLSGNSFLYILGKNTTKVLFQ